MLSWKTAGTVCMFCCCHWLPPILSWCPPKTNPTHIIIGHFYPPLFKLFSCFFNLLEVCWQHLGLFPLDENLILELNFIFVCYFADFCAEARDHFKGCSTAITYVLLFERFKVWFFDRLKNKCAVLDSSEFFIFNDSSCMLFLTLAPVEGCVFCLDCVIISPRIFRCCPLDLVISYNLSIMCLA